MAKTKCPHCGSNEVQSRGIRNHKRQFRCKSCGKYHSVSSNIENYDSILDDYNNDYDSYIITSYQPDSVVNETFIKSLEKYASELNAKIYIIQTKAKADDYDISQLVEPYILDHNVRIHDNLKILGKLKISPTAANPLSGLDAISKGDSVIIGHPQLQLKTLPVAQSDFPVILTTTGTVSETNYTETKLGYKAEFNHTLSATIVQIDRFNDIYHLRQLEFDGKGFYDLDKYITSNSIEISDSVEALIPGDEHAIFNDNNVLHATYLDQSSIKNVLKPKQIIRHDVLDCYSVSHHHQNNIFTKYGKYIAGSDSVEEELEYTAAFIDQTGVGAKNVIIPSNHTDHLTQWLNMCDPKVEPWNALFYHKMMYLMLESTTMEDNGVKYPNPFELYINTQNLDVDLEFVERNSSYKVHGIECAFHGDKGNNGSRGSRSQYSKLPYKTVIGHSHSPGIEKGCYQVGTSSYLQLEYNLGPSSWMHTHCIIYKNGKRTLINIIDGMWRA